MLEKIKSAIVNDNFYKGLIYIIKNGSTWDRISTIITLIIISFMFDGLFSFIIAIICIYLDWLYISKIGETKK